MNIETFKEKLKTAPKEVTFENTMVVVETNYNFTPTAFTNGTLRNEAGQNSGSCKVFAFALKQGLTKDETLACFGRYYFDEVLNDIEGNGHQNIRNFMKTGFEGLSFEGEALL
jgi:hypothetical protein